MSISQEKFINIWQKRIAKGRNSYIIKFALLWGVGIIIFMSLFNTIFEGIFTIDSFVSGFTKDIYIKLIIFPISGAILGYINWNNGVKRYKKITEPQEAEEND